MRTHKVRAYAIPMLFAAAIAQAGIVAENYGKFSPTPIRTIQAEKQDSDKVMLIGVVSDKKLTSKGEAESYMLKGHEGAQIRVRVIRTSTPLLNDHVLVMGAVTVDPLLKEKYVTEADWTLLDADKIRKVIADSNENVVEAIKVIAAKEEGFIVQAGPVPPPPPPPPPPSIPYWVWWVVGGLCAFVVLVVLFALVFWVRSEAEKKRIAEENRIKALQAEEERIKEEERRRKEDRGDKNPTVDTGETVVGLGSVKIADDGNTIVPMGFFEIISGGPSGVRIPLNPPYSIIGRRDKARDRGSAYISLETEDKGVSRAQARIVKNMATGEYTIQNVGRVGTVVEVDGKALRGFGNTGEPAEGDMTALADGATVRLPGNYAFKFMDRK